MKREISKYDTLLSTLGTMRDLTDKAWKRLRRKFTGTLRHNIKEYLAVDRELVSSKDLTVGSMSVARLDNMLLDSVCMTPWSKINSNVDASVVEKVLGVYLKINRYKLVDVVRHV